MFKHVITLILTAACATLTLTGCGSPETVMLIQRPSLAGDSFVQIHEADGEVNHFKRVDFEHGKLILDSSTLAGLPDGTYAINVKDPNGYFEDLLFVRLDDGNVTRQER